MRKGNPLIVWAIWIGMGIWLALDGYINIVIFLIAGAVLVVTFQLTVGGLICWIERIREKRKNRKSN